LSQPYPWFSGIDADGLLQRQQSQKQKLISLPPQKPFLTDLILLKNLHHVHPPILLTPAIRHNQMVLPISTLNLNDQHQVAFSLSGYRLDPTLSQMAILSILLPKPQARLGPKA